MHIYIGIAHYLGVTKKRRILISQMKELKIYFWKTNMAAVTSCDNLFLFNSKKIQLSQNGCFIVHKLSLIHGLPSGGGWSFNTELGEG